jgi:hypothetical protein
MAALPPKAATWLNVSFGRSLVELWHASLEEWRAEFAGFSGTVRRPGARPLKRNNPYAEFASDETVEGRVSPHR